MLKIKDAILVNKYGQGITNIDSLIDMFNNFDLEKKRDYLEEILSLILQSKPNDNDIEHAIKQSKLKPTYTPCILLRKGVANHNLKRLVKLPENELTKSLILLLSLFKIAYKRRFQSEKNNPDKWWYWDLSDSNNVEIILSKV